MVQLLPETDFTAFSVEVRADQFACHRGRIPVWYGLLY